MATDEELIKNYREYMQEMRQRKLDANALLIANFTKYCATKGLALTADNFDYVQTIGIVAKHPGLLKILTDDFPRDKEHLFSFRRLKERFTVGADRPGFVIDEHFMLMAHPHFRRGFSAGCNYAPHFVDIFWGYDNGMAESFIALDDDRVRIDIDGSLYMEFDTWYGPLFSKLIGAIPNGCTRLRPPSDLDEMYISALFHDVYALDVEWSQRESIKTFQAMEFNADNIQVEINGEKRCPAKYLHAEFDMKANSFRHIDGAVQYFREDEYLGRRESDFNYNHKNPRQIKPPSCKLFKINGQIDIDAFIQLSSHYFSGNPLMYEYFSGKLPPYLENALSSIRAHRSP